MSVVNVKITDLDLHSEDEIKESDLFLKASYVGLDGDGNKVYESETTSLSSIAECLTNKPRTVTKQWTFESGPNPPIQTTRFDPREFFNDYIVFSQTNREGVIQITGNYLNNSTFFPAQYDPKTILKAEDSSMYSFANTDYVNRVTAAAHKSLLTIFNNISIHLYQDGDAVVLPSFVGDIVFTTHNYADNNALRAIYGDGSILINDTNNGVVIRKPNTNWVKHSGDFMFRATTDISKVNKSSLSQIKNKDDGKNEGRTLQLEEHNHTIGSHTHGYNYTAPTANDGLAVTIKDVQGDHGSAWHGRSHPARFQITKSDNVDLSVSGSCSDKGEFYTAYAGEGNTLDIRESYKKVYVWERVS